MTSPRNFSRLAGRALLVAGALALLAAPSLLAEDAAGPSEESQAKALEIVKKADAAIKKVDSVRFVGSSEPTGIAETFSAKAHGHGYMVGWHEAYGIPQSFYGKATTERDGKDVEIEGGGNGDTYFLVDHGTKKGYEDIDPNVMGTTGNALRGIGMQEFVHTAPFDDELASPLDYQGTEKVGDEECHKIHVVYSGGRGESTWYFSTEDYLPRRRVRLFKSPAGDGTIDVQVTELEVSPKIDPAIFTMKLPEGYERVDDFAP